MGKLHERYTRAPALNCRLKSSSTGASAMARQTSTAFATLVLLLCFGAATKAQTSVFTYQGRLSDGAGNANGTYEMQFSLYDNPSGPTQIGSTITNGAVSVVNGIFTVQLSFAAPNAFDGNARWLEIAVRKSTDPPGFSVLSPRQQITSSPYSIRTISAGVADNAANLGGVPAAQYVQTNDSRLTDARTPTAGSPNYVQNTAAQQPTSNFNISGNGTIGSTLKVGAAVLPPGTGATGIFGTATGSNGNGVYGNASGTGAAGIYGKAEFYGVLGDATGSTGLGVSGSANSPNGFGVVGQNTTGTAVAGLSNSGLGVQGSSSGANGVGVRGHNAATSGTGVFGIGNGITATTPPPGAGAGVAGYGTTQGMYAYATSAATGTGLVAAGNNAPTVFLTGEGAGITATGNMWGSVGFATSPLANDRWAGYFDYVSSLNGYAYVGGRSSGTDYGILSTGAKSTMVRGLSGENRIMFATEAPEVLFQDFGNGQLHDGQAVIVLDPMLAANITINPDHPLRVFIQLEDDCKGVFVTGKSAGGFTVTELGGGKSNARFTWQIVANRADAVDDSGTRLDADGKPATSKFTDVRFPVGPARPNLRKFEVAPIKPAVHSADPAVPLVGRPTAFPVQKPPAP
jgi:hypothetical protein